MQKSVNLVIESGVVSRHVVTDHLDELLPLAHLSYRVVLHDSAQFELSVALTQVQDCTIDIELDLQGDGARADVIVLYGLSGQQNLKINTIQKHYGKQTTSAVVACGIVTGQAYVAYQGMISLQPGSKRADAKQEHTTIVLSKQAKVVSIPSIEVLHHDVQCCHGAAIGQFHEQQLWYLQSRGFEKNVAYQMLVHSFFAEHMHRFLPDTGSNKNSFTLVVPDSAVSAIAGSEGWKPGSSDNNSSLLESLCQKIL